MPQFLRRLIDHGIGGVSEAVEEIAEPAAFVLEVSEFLLYVLFDVMPHQLMQRLVIHL